MEKTVKSSLYTIAGAAALGMIAKAKSASANIKHDIFNPNNVHSSTSASKLMQQANKGFKDGSVVGAELVGNSSQLVHTLQDNSVNAIITSPPYYGVAKYTDNEAEIGAPNSEKRKYVEDLVTLFVNLKSKLKDDGTLWVNLGNKNADQEMISVFNAAMLANGWFIVQKIVWSKSNSMPKGVSKKAGMPKFPLDAEVIFVYAKNKNKYNLYALLKPTTSKKGRKYSDRRARNARGELTVQSAKAKTVKNWQVMGNIWKSGNITPIDTDMDEVVFDNVFGQTEYSFMKYAYSTARHVAIMNPIIVRNCIWAATKPGDVILDPFSGTGTVTNIAKMMGRIGIGFELDTIHALMAVVGKDFAYTDLWKKVKIRDEINKKDQTTEPLPDSHKDYQMNVKEVSKGKSHFLRGDTPYKTKLINFNTVRFSDNPLWKHISINPNSQQIIASSQKTIKELLDIIYGKEDK